MGVVCLFTKFSYSKVCVGFVVKIHQEKSQEILQVQVVLLQNSRQGGASLDDTHVSPETGKGRIELMPDVFVGCRHMTQKKLLVLSTAAESCKDHFDGALSKKPLQMLSESECL